MRLTGSVLCYFYFKKFAVDSDVSGGITDTVIYAKKSFAMSALSFASFA